jgi:hypothetical protein
MRCGAAIDADSCFAPADNRSFPWCFPAPGRFFVWLAAIVEGASLAIFFAAACPNYGHCAPQNNATGVTIGTSV